MRVRKVLQGWNRLNKRVDIISCMMKILFDFLTVADKNGAAEYTRSVFYALLGRMESEELADVQLYCLYDSQAKPIYDDLSPNGFDHPQVKFIDYQLGSRIINSMHFEVFFLACAHSAGWHPDVANYTCKALIVAHDCVWEEIYNNDLSIYMKLNTEDLFRYRERVPMGKKVYWDIKSPTIRFCRWLLHSREHGLLEMDAKSLSPAMDLFRRRKDNEIITVSHYSMSSLLYNFRVPAERVRVLYSPERIYKDSKALEDQVCNEKLKSLIESNTRYFLLVSAGRENKNSKKALRAFHTYSTKNKDVFLVTVGFKKELFANHVDLDFLNDWDLQSAYKNCYALLFPSIFEGFGYPPLEAMKYGKPVLSSNTCSMPEILGNAPIYFSPFYESAIFHALRTLNGQNYSDYAEKSIRQYELVHQRQREDLALLTEKILAG